MNAAPVASSASGLHETRIITAAEISMWMRSAAAGDSLVYCTGPSMLPGPTLVLLQRLIGEGKIVTHKRRGGDGVLEHLLVKQRPPAPPPSEPQAEADPAMERIFEALARCVERRRRAHSDHDLAKIAGLATRNQAAWRVRKLAEAGRIGIETAIAADGTRWRVVTVAGRSTLRPPSSSAGAGSKEER